MLNYAFTMFAYVVIQMTRKIQEYNYMMLSHYITPDEKRWLFESTETTSNYPELELCLLGYFLNTPCFILEVIRIQLGDVLTKQGKLRRSFFIRDEKGFNGEQRKVFIRNSELRQLTMNYINWRVKNNVGQGEHPDYYLGLNPDEALLVTKGTAIRSLLKELRKET